MSMLKKDVLHTLSRHRPNRKIELEKRSVVIFREAPFGS